MEDKKAIWDSYIQTMLFDFKNPELRGKDFNWNKFPEIVANHVTSQAFIHYNHSISEEIKSSIYEYVFEKATARIKNKDHLPESTMSWFRNIDNHSQPRTIMNWIHETIEGNSAFHVARYAKENFMTDMSYCMFITKCGDLSMKWELASRSLYAINVNVLDFEDHIVKHYYDYKPKEYTIDKNLTQHLGWFLETLNRGRYEEYIHHKFEVAINVFFMSHTKDMNL